jgi:hypothetical protein
MESDVSPTSVPVARRSRTRAALAVLRGCGIVQVEAHWHALRFGVDRGADQEQVSIWSRTGLFSRTPWRKIERDYIGTHQ